jgi:hypothetical protein
MSSIGGPGFSSSISRFVAASEPKSGDSEGRRIDADVQATSAPQQQEPQDLEMKALNQELRALGDRLAEEFNQALDLKSGRDGKIVWKEPQT